MVDTRLIVVPPTETTAHLAEVGVPSASADVRDVGDVSLHCVAAGDPADPLVVLLHGFPEFWYEWRDYVGRFVDAGYRVLVPDQRGYNLSEKPDGARAYRTSALARDVLGLVESEDRTSAHLLGHDWGAAVAWEVALRHPDAVDRLGIVNVPHPSAFEAALRSNPAQMRRSWYVFFFQLPRLPEWYARRDGFAFFERAMVEDARPGAFEAGDVDRYRRAWSREGALTAMLDWYRALLRHRDDPPRETVTAPTLVAWGDRDRALLPELAAASLDYCRDGRLERFPEATHWLPHEYPERVADSFVEHFDG
ncbi:alpha/beta hydrolase [Halarchaeum grantii]|uniref:Alpha/beta hydrolase n=1 Tax=Halarchaeum grantii TaxID=1193105 RepID=A0A830EZC7_9EURY|nr:alpha/beta hydrolase [Halarchaeum grantii]